MGGAPPSGQDREAGAPQPLQLRSGAFSKSLTPTGSASPAGQWGREGEWICSRLSPPLHTVRDSKIRKDGAGPRALGFTWSTATPSLCGVPPGPHDHH